MKNVITSCVVAVALLISLGGTAASAANAASADDKAPQATSSTGEKINDAWILTKVKGQFIGEDALEGSNIDADVKNGVVTLKGTVVTEAGRARALEVTRKTEGVVRVVDQLKLAPPRTRTEPEETRDQAQATRDAAQATRDAGREARREVSTDAKDLERDAKRAERDAKQAERDAKRAARDANREGQAATGAAASEVKEETREAAAEVRQETREAKDEAREATTKTKGAGREMEQEAREAGRESRQAAGTAGQAVSDGWISTKVKASFVGEDALEGSNIMVDTNGQVVTLRGTVRSEAGRKRAVAIAKSIDGVKSVKDELKIGVKQ